MVISAITDQKRLKNSKIAERSIIKGSARKFFEEKGYIYGKYELYRLKRQKELNVIKNI